MIKPTTLRQIAMTFAISPAVAKATIYMPSQVAARVLGGRSAERRSREHKAEQPSRDATHAA